MIPNPASRKPVWTMLLLPLGLAAVMAPVIVLASTGPANTLVAGFDSVVHGIESRYHAHATRIPFAGIVSGLAGAATHGGVHQLRVADFEHFNQPVDGEELNQLVSQRIGEGWQRMIRETSRSGGDQTLIFVRPEGDRIGMMILDLDGHELDVVGMSINPDQLIQQLHDPTQHPHEAHHPDADKDSEATPKQHTEE